VAHQIDMVRNIALTGHSGAGKTVLAEAMLFNAGKLNRMGRIEDGSTVSDYDKDEIERGISISTSLLTATWGEHHIDVMDTPGYADFMPAAHSALRVADGSVVVVEAVAGIDVGTERVWRLAEEHGLPAIVHINKMDRDEIELENVMAQIKDRFGREAVPLQYAVNPGEGFNQIVDLVNMKLLTYADGKATESEIAGDLAETAAQLHEELVEMVAETDEELMEKYFGEGDFEPADLTSALRKAVLERQLFPVLFGDAYNNVGVNLLMDAVASYFPSPSESPGLAVKDADGNDVTLEADAAAPLAAFVFKTIAEQHVGELSVLRVYSGSLKTGDEVSNVTRGNSERIGQIFELNGHTRDEVTAAGPGDIVALVKLKDTHTGDVLCARGKSVDLPGVQFTDPLIRVAVSPREKGSEDRMATGLSQLHEEDSSFVFQYDGEIRQSILATQGDLHLETILKRLRERFGVEVDTESPKIPYRETIRGNAEGHHRHKKQTGGRGQFGEVYLRVEPLERGQGFEFGNDVVGGNIPHNFIPAVEKGIVETLTEGPISASSVVDVKATVYDGKHHAVDSDEVSFKLAASHAFKDAFLKAKPVLLEPIYRLNIVVPEEFMGDVMGDLSSHRGRIIGTDSDGHFQIINAEIPLSEIDRYATRLRSMTQGRGIHTQELDRFQEAPGDVQARIAEESKQKEEED